MSGFNRGDKVVVNGCGSSWYGDVVDDTPEDAYLVEFDMGENVSAILPIHSKYIQTDQKGRRMSEFNIGDAVTVDGGQEVRWLNFGIGDGDWLVSSHCLSIKGGTWVNESRMTLHPESAPARPTGFKEGQRVRLEGVDLAATLKGTEGRVVRRDNRILGGSPRWLVALDLLDGGTVTVRQDQLIPIETDAFIPTLAENVARVRAERAAKIAAAGYSLPGDRQPIEIESDQDHSNVIAMLKAGMKSRDQRNREQAFAWFQLIFGEEPKPACDGQANTSGIKRDFEAGGLAGGPR